MTLDTSAGSPHATLAGLSLSSTAAASRPPPPSSSLSPPSPTKVNPLSLFSIFVELLVRFVSCDIYYISHGLGALASLLASPHCVRAISEQQEIKAGGASSASVVQAAHASKGGKVNGMSALVQLVSRMLDPGIPPRVLRMACGAGACLAQCALRFVGGGKYNNSSSSDRDRDVGEKRLDGGFSLLRLLVQSGTIEKLMRLLQVSDNICVCVCVWKEREREREMITHEMCLMQRKDGEFGEEKEDDTQAGAAEIATLFGHSAGQFTSTYDAIYISILSIFLSYL